MQQISLVFLCLLFGFGLPPSNDFHNYQEQIDDLTIDMVAIKGGRFEMGSTNDARPDETPLHKVTVGDFWMASHELSWALYQQFLDRDKNESYTSLKDLGIDGISSASTPYVDMSFGMGKDGFPATSMTQYAALMYCKWLSAKTGHFYRLPTEAEWEYACKKEQDQQKLEEKAWFADNSNEAYHKIATKMPSPSGLYDMQGNVAEWTMDQYQKDFYKKSPKNNPWASPKTLYPRTLRGGSWNDEAEDCSCTARKASNAKWKRIDPQLPKSKWWHTNAPFIGIRLVRPNPQPKSKDIQKYWLDLIEDY